MRGEKRDGDCLTSIPTRYAVAIRIWRSTPSLRTAGFENEDENEGIRVSLALMVLDARSKK